MTRGSILTRSLECYCCRGDRALAEACKEEGLKLIRNRLDVEGVKILRKDVSQLRRTEMEELNSVTVVKGD